MKHRMIIDCDPGHDDAIALILAHKVADVVGITTVTGNAPLADTTRNALTVVELLGVDTPVYAGADRPLAGEPRHAAHVHGATGLGGVTLPAPRRALAGSDAVGYLLEETRRQPGLWIVPIGPLTNIALALQRDPTLPQRIAGLSIMGGSATYGNATAAAEFNIWADPDAAAVVFESGALIRMCGLNLTHQLRTSDDWLEQLPTTPPGQFVRDLFGFLHTRMQELIGERRSALHDPCAVLAVTHPELIEMRQRHVVVETEGRHTRGMTLVDERPARIKPAANTEVAYRIDADAATTLILDAIATS